MWQPKELISVYALSLSLFRSLAQLTFNSIYIFRNHIFFSQYRISWLNGDGKEKKKKKRKKKTHDKKQKWFKYNRNRRQ